MCICKGEGAKGRVARVSRLERNMWVWRVSRRRGIAEGGEGQVSRLEG